MFFNILIGNCDGETVRLRRNISPCEDGSIVVSLSPEEVGCAKWVKIEMPAFSAVAGDEGYYVSAYNGGALTYFTGRSDCDLFDDDIGGTAVSMPIFGVRKEGRAYLAICRGMTYDSKFVPVCHDNEYSCYLYVDTDNEIPYESIELLILPINDEDADYSAIARRYREYQLGRGVCKPLSEKIRDNQKLKYLSDSVNIRIRMGWKPVPPEIEEQTPENEPEMKVACTFYDVEELIDELKSLGVEKADICLVGYNKSGHDGRWPQLFPIEEKFGGEEGLKKLIKKAKDAGYYLNFHTNCVDAYSIADVFSEDIIMRHKDGSLSTHPVSFSAGKPYRLCPPSIFDYFVSNLDKLTELGADGAHYIDCLTVIAPRKCYDKRHPLNRKQWTAWMNRFFVEAKKRFGSVSSEGGMDFAAEVLDFALYSAWKVLGEKERAIVDDFVPLWQLVYHGIMLYNATTETVNYTVKGMENHLKQYEYGGRPSAYCFSRFQSGNVDFLGLEDIVLGEGDATKIAAEKIAEMDREYKKHASTVLAFMDKHEKLSEGVYKTTYSNGTSVVCDYNDGSIKINEK